MCCSVALAQTTESTVLVRNAGMGNSKQHISVKWYSRSLYYEGGVNLYRKEGQGVWQKLNKLPIRKLDSLSKSEYAADEDLEFFVPYINESKKSDVNGLFLINVLVKSFESEVFSKFLGILYNDTSVIVGNTYTYKIMQLKGTSEVLLAESKPIVAGPETKEATVQDIIYKADTNKVYIKWKPEEKRFFAVNVYRGTDSIPMTLISQPPVMVSRYTDSLGRLQYPSVFYLDDTLKPGTYYYQLAGLDFFGKETQYSEKLKVEVEDLIAPPAPENLEDTIRNLDVTLSWKNTIVSDLNGTNVYRSVKSNGPFVKLNTQLLGVDITSYKDQVPHAGPYYYYVTAVDKVGNENKSYMIFSEVHDIVPPEVPVKLTAVSDTGMIRLTWQQNLEGDLKGYMIYRSVSKNDKNTFVLLNSTPIKEAFYTDRLPRNARNEFIYKILAIDTSFNKSDYSSIASVKMPDVTPPVKPLIIGVTNEEESIQLRWLANRDEDLKGYELYRSTDAETYTIINKELIPVSVLSYKDSDIRSAATYMYYLKAVDSSGNKSLSSNIEKGYTRFSSLEAPKEFKGKYNKSKKAVLLSWKATESELTSFVIYRSDKEIGALKPLSGKLMEHTYSDSSVISGNTYVYQIRLYDTSGNTIQSQVIKITIK